MRGDRGPVVADPQAHRVAVVEPGREVGEGRVGEADAERAAAGARRDGAAEALAGLLPQSGGDERELAAVVEAELGGVSRIGADADDAQETVLDPQVAPLLSDLEAGLAGRREVEAFEKERTHARVSDRVVLKEELAVPIEPERDLAPQPLEGFRVEGRHGAVSVRARPTCACRGTSAISRP